MGKLTVGFEGTERNEVGPQPNDCPLVYLESSILTRGGQERGWVVGGSWPWTLAARRTVTNRHRTLLFLFTDGTYSNMLMFWLWIGFRKSIWWLYSKESNKRQYYTLLKFYFSRETPSLHNLSHNFFKFGLFAFPQRSYMDISLIWIWWQHTSVIVIKQLTFQFWIEFKEKTNKFEASPIQYSSIHSCCNSIKFQLKSINSFLFIVYLFYIPEFPFRN